MPSLEQTYVSIDPESPKTPSVEGLPTPKSPKTTSPKKKDAPVPPAPPKADPPKPANPFAPPIEYVIKDLGLKDVDLVVGGKDPTSGAVVAFPLRRINLISASTVLADMLKTKPQAFGSGPDSIKNLPYLQLDENGLLMERILPFLYNDLDLPKTTDIHFVRAVYQAAYKYKMRRLFDWMTEKIKAGWSSAPPETMINLYAVVKKAEDADLATVILTGILDKYNWTLHREGENKWTCDSGTGPRALKDCTDIHGFEILLAIANRRHCMFCKKAPFKEAKEEKPLEEAKC